jgi:hypothetical protein
MGWRELLEHHVLPELRIGDDTSEYVAIRPVSILGKWGNVALLIRGTDIAWSGIAAVEAKD